MAVFSRMRSRDDIGLGRYHYTYLDPSGFYDSINDFHIPYRQGTSFTSIDRIYDVPKKFRSSGHYPDTPVAHGSLKQLTKPLPFSFTHYNGAAVNMLDYSIPYNDATWRQPAFPDMPADVLSSLCWPKFILWQQQIPSSGTNIGNFVFELQEWEQLIPKLEGSLAGVAENGFLSFEFGSSPFFSDLQNLSNLASSVSSRIKYLKKTLGKRVRLSEYIRDAWTPSLNTTILSFGHDFSDGAWPFHFELRILDCHVNFRLGAYQVNNLIGLDDNEAIFRAFYTALGLGNLAKTVWNGIPFSFVVDWFAKIGTQLDSLNTQPFDGGWSISNVNWSYQLTGHVGCYVVFDSPNSGEFLTTTYEWKDYARQPGLPIRLVDFTDDLSPTQLSLLFSMLHRGVVS